MRLDKFLCELNIGSRNQVKSLLKKGLVSVNNTIVTKPDTKIKETEDVVTFGGKVLQYQTFLYYMLHKPMGVVSATVDNTAKTVIEVLLERMKENGVESRLHLSTETLFPVGRLDKDTEGLLLITNDGLLAHKLLSPKNHVPKTYYAKLEKHLSTHDIHDLEQGVDIGEDKLTAAAQITILNQEEPPSPESSDKVQEIMITITEGKYHQVKRMFHAVGNQVIYLKRISMGNLMLDETLSIGEYRELTDREVQELRFMSEINLERGYIGK